MQNTQTRRLLVTIFILAALLRFATVWCGTNVDEGVYWVEGKQLVDGYTIYRDTQFNKPPLVAFVSVPFFILGDTPIYPMRIAMIAFSLLGLYWIYQLTRTLFGKQAGFAAALLVALEPFSCVWAKYLHTSTWAPFFEAGIFYYLITGLRNQNKKSIVLSGIILGLYALTKQSAIFVVPIAILAWWLFRKQRTLRNGSIDGSMWTLGVLTIYGPFLLYLTLSGLFASFWFDIWTAHHLMADWFKHHTLSFRIHEMNVVMQTAPVLWLLPFGSLVLLRGPYRRAMVFGWAWLILVFWGNAFFISHIWKHYLLVAVFPCALLGGAFWAWVVKAVSKEIANTKAPISPIKRCLAGLLILLFAMLIGWSKQDWTYPGLTLHEEQQLARYINRACRGDYLLNLTNPAFYVWTDKKIPPAMQGDRVTRIPYFMTIAGRGYMTREDIQNTVTLWDTEGVDCIIAYDKYISQLSTDPIMEPMKTWILDNFKEPRRVNMGQSYYGWFWLFEKK
jgi:4-amino-4-deoxy-L-arabinose transferase-like glycosyltransferase